MDADSNDGTVAEALNGETKPDVAKLAQSAIIKQVGEPFLLCNHTINIIYKSHLSLLFLKLSTLPLYRLF